MHLTTLLRTFTACALLACGGNNNTSTTSDASTSDPAGSSSDTGPSDGVPTTSDATTSAGDGSAGTSTTEASTTTTGATGATSSTSEPATSSSTSTTDPLDPSTTDASTGTSTGEPETSESGSTEIDSCAELLPIFNQEVLEIRNCTADAECGVEMQGTSCGCTRNWVARLDADLKEFEALVAKANELGCELPFVSTCDCPAAEGFACVNNTCTWNYL